MINPCYLYLQFYLWVGAECAVGLVSSTQCLLSVYLSPVSVGLSFVEFAAIDTSLTVENVIFAAERLSLMLAIIVIMGHSKVTV